MLRNGTQDGNNEKKSKLVARLPKPDSLMFTCLYKHLPASKLFGPRQQNTVVLKFDETGGVEEQKKHARFVWKGQSSMRLSLCFALLVASQGFSPRAPWIGTATDSLRYRGQWRQANSITPTSSRGTLLSLSFPGSPVSMSQSDTAMDDQKGEKTSGRKTDDQEWGVIMETFRMYKAAYGDLKVSFDGILTIQSHEGMSICIEVAQVWSTHSAL